MEGILTKEEENLKKIRDLMSKNSFNAYIVPHSDAHDVKSLI